ncbi:hypothetical protein QWZ08_20040 [Ferruginibacter paludis]|uniref:hypothetical protein n=1 Tax=Ferruginibacter paludis TaxID=1310417 RepID=UPI0025B3E3BA|nr:hypothetical protein [Ferruginibacter paludis]MDN3657955.1 hypothetical protein [Ferruginibacter paludis]
MTTDEILAKYPAEHRAEIVEAVKQQIGAAKKEDLSLTQDDIKKWAAMEAVAKNK